MNFQEYLNTLPDIAHLKGLDITTPDGTLLRHIPAAPGKLGSLRVYYALALQFNGCLNTEAAKQGLVWFAEHVADAQANLGKHPNIDFLFEIAEHGSEYRLNPIQAA